MGLKNNAAIKVEIGCEPLSINAYPIHMDKSTGQHVRAESPEYIHNGFTEICLRLKLKSKHIHTGEPFLLDQYPMYVNKAEYGALNKLVNAGLNQAVEENKFKSTEKRAINSLKSKLPVGLSIERVRNYGWSLGPEYNPIEIFGLQDRDEN